MMDSCLNPDLVYQRRDQNLLTWSDSAIYIFTPQNGQVLLWTEVKGEDVLSDLQWQPSKWTYSWPTLINFTFILNRFIENQRIFDISVISSCFRFNTFALIVLFCRLVWCRSPPRWAVLSPWQWTSVPPLLVVCGALRWASAAAGVLDSSCRRLLHVPARHHHQQGKKAADLLFVHSHALF